MSVGAVPSSASASDESTALAARLLADKTATLARLAAGIAHELRNPLAVILARVQLLELAMKGGKPLPPGKLETTLRTVGEQAVRASKIIESLSIFARPRVPVLESVDLGQIIGHVLSDLRAESSEDRIVTTEVDVAPEAMTVVADSGQLTTALRQLTLNALQAMADGGRLRIHARARDGSVEVIVGDTGGGIATHDAARIFDPFFTTKPSGTGLGLCVAQTIAEAHGGSVRLMASGGPGAEFVLSLPTRWRVP